VEILESQEGLTSWHRNFLNNLKIVDMTSKNFEKRVSFSSPPSGNIETLEEIEGTSATEQSNEVLKGELENGENSLQTSHDGTESLD
jgi:hypothetical protein